MKITSDIQSIMDALNVDELPVEEQEDLVLNLSDIVSESTIVGLLERMDDATLEEFSKLIDDNPSEADIEAFLAEKAPYAQEVVEETVEELKNDILSVTNE